MTMLFYEDEQELAGLGYPGPARKRYLALVPAALPVAEADQVAT
jgi:hypothetical protein